MPDSLDTQKFLGILAGMEIHFVLAFWLIVGVLLLIAEMFTGTLYLLFAAGAAFLTALLEWLIPWPLYIEFLLFAAFSVLGIFILKKKFREPKVDFKKESKGGFKNDENRSLTLSDSIASGEEKIVTYQGSPWTAINHSDRNLRAGESVKIIRMEGIKLILGPQDNN